MPGAQLFFANLNLMTMRKIWLQAHRIRALIATLQQVVTKAEQEEKFLKDFSEIYHMPKKRTRDNLRNLALVKKAAELIIEHFSRYGAPTAKNNSRATERPPLRPIQGAAAGTAHDENRRPARRIA